MRQFLSIGLLALFLVAGGPTHATRYYYQGPPLLGRLADDRPVVIAIQGEANERRDRIRIFIDGEEQRSFRIDPSRPQRRVGFDYGGSTFSVSCASILPRYGSELGLRVADCDVSIDGVHTGSIRPETLFVRDEPN